MKQTHTPAKGDFLPIILGSDDNAYGTARLIHECYGDSVRPLLLCTRPLRATAHSRIFDIKILPDFDTDEVFIKELRAILREMKKQYKVITVTPCADYYLYLLSRHYNKFEGNIANPVISEELLRQLDTKDSFYTLCEKHGLPYPKTLVAEKDDRENILDGENTLSFPIVVKPENSNATDYLHCQFEGKKKVFFFRTKDEYLAMVAAMNRSDYDGKLILQEYIPGDDSAMRTLNAYCGSDGKVKCTVLGQPVLEEYAPKTLGNYAAILTRQDPQIEQKLANFLEEIGYLGFANFDLKYDEKRGRYYLFEINPRLGRSSFFVRGCGVNFLSLMIEDCVYGQRDPLPVVYRKALWSAVPNSVLKRYIRNSEVRREVLTLLKKEKPLRTLFYEPDLKGNLKRRILMLRHLYSYVKVYRQYFFEKSSN